MKDIDVNEAMARDALDKEPVTGETIHRLVELQQVFDRFPSVWRWLDMTMDEAARKGVPNEVMGLVTSFAYFKLLKMLSEANKSQQRLKDIKGSQLPWLTAVPKTAREETLRLHEWAKESYPNCVMWYDLTIARWIHEGEGIGGYQACINVAELVEMLEQANAD